MRRPAAAPPDRLYDRWWRSQRQPVDRHWTRRLPSRSREIGDIAAGRSETLQRVDRRRYSGEIGDAAAGRSETLQRGDRRRYSGEIGDVTAGRSDTL